MTTEIENAPDTAQIEAEARGMGWRPQEEWTGDPDRWTDAETFVKKGREVLPILRASNRKLETRLAEAEARAARLETLFQNSQEALAGLKVAAVENSRAAAEQARRDLLKELKTARAEGDVEAEDEIQGELTKVRAAIAEADGEIEEAKKPKQRVQPKGGTADNVDPAFAEWAKENTWFGQDQRRTVQFMGAANILRADPANDHLQGKEFIEQVEKYVANGSRPPSKAAGASHTGAGGGGGGGKSYKDLPQDAKDACARQGRKLVGEGRAYKTDAEWQKAYAETYFNS